MSDLSGVIQDLSISIDGLAQETALTNRLLQALLIHQVGGDLESVIKALPDEVRSRVWQASEHHRRATETSHKP